MLKNGTLKIALTGETAILANKCIHVFEIEYTCNKFMLKVNGEFKYIYEVEIDR